VGEPISHSIMKKTVILENDLHIVSRQDFELGLVLRRDGKLAVGK